MLHVSPEANNIGELLPHSLILPYRLTALLNERLNAVLLNLLLAVKSQSLLYLKLNRQAVGIPSSLSQNLLALHGLITRQHILDYTCKNVSDMGLAVCCRGAVIKGKGVTAFSLINSLIGNVFFFPEIQNLMLSVNKIELRVDFFVQSNSS